MADQEEVEDSAAEQQPVNSFTNDGSFLEQFRKMQEMKDKEKQEKEAEKKAKLNKPLFSRAGGKRRPMMMRVGGFKKGLMPGAKLKKPADTMKAFQEDKEAELSNNHGNTAVQGSPGAAVETSSSLPSVKKSRFSDTPPPGLDMGTGLAPGQSSSAVDSTLSDQPVKKKKSRFSDVPPPGPSETSTGTEQPVRKRKSRFSDAPPTINDSSISQAISSFSGPPVTQQALSETQRQQILEQIEMNKLVAEVKAATQAANASRPAVGSGVTYEYDSDEDTEGGTWEHKKRAQEMVETYSKAQELTVMNQGKHHIGDFLPPEELNHFIEKVNAIKEGRTPDFSDYKDHKLTADNVGFQMLQKAGWTEGSGLGSNQDGILDPINKGKASFDQSGVGAAPPAEVKKEDDPFDIYRKRMMLAYRFRPNPLNNPRRPYY